MVVEKRNVITDIDYDEYVRRQGRKVHNPEKLRTLLSKIPGRIQRFETIFRKVSGDLIPGRVLCLGARTGCEIKGARNAGFHRSQGIDLHPINKIVIKGDWHDIPFPDGSFENVYSNSIDHCFDVGKLAHEIHRVLRPCGVFYFQILVKQMLANFDTPDAKQKNVRKSSNFLFWEDGPDMTREFEKYGFRLIRDWQDHKWYNALMERVG